jgi:hypothetical protein
MRNPLKLPFFDIVIVFTGASGGYRKETLRAVNFKTNPMGVKMGDTKIISKITLAIGNIDF